jgi:hypothetical protein
LSHLENDSNGQILLDDLHVDNPQQRMEQAGLAAETLKDLSFMGMLGKRFPEAQFLITGLLAPKSNAHGPNQFLHIETGKRLTSCVAQVLEDHYARSGG